MKSLLHRLLIALSATSPLLMAQQVAAKQLESGSGAVFALIDSNEWCPGGSVYLDLQTGSFMLYPRVSQPACQETKLRSAIEHGILGADALERVRSAYAEARRAGLRRSTCDFVISNGGPQAVAITASGFSATTPEELGCWSEEATALYQALFENFGKKREAGR